MLLIYAETDGRGLDDKADDIDDFNELMNEQPRSASPHALFRQSIGSVIDV